MCQAIRFMKNEYPAEVLEKHQFEISVDEVRIHFAKKDAFLPVLLNGQNQLIKWGNKENLKIPRTGFCKIESYQAGKWQWLNPNPVTIIASSALVNGAWFQVKQGIQGLLLNSELGTQHCYMLTQPSTHYFRTMTGAERMPVLVNQVL